MNVVKTLVQAGLLAALVLLVACGRSPDNTVAQDAGSETSSSSASEIKLVAGAESADSMVIEVYKSPTCGCCGKWVDHLRSNGFTVNTHDHRNMNPVKERLGVPDQLQSCHTATVGPYVIEGHVPAQDIKRLLKERPLHKGLAVPGMPLGSPGMEHPHPEHYATLSFGDDQDVAVFAEHFADQNEAR